MLVAAAKLRWHPASLDARDLTAESMLVNGFGKESL